MKIMKIRFNKIFILFLTSVTCDGIFNHDQVKDDITTSKVFGDERLYRPEWILINRTSQIKNTLFSSQDSCVRYCIENSKKEARFEQPDNENNYINIIWQIGKENSGKLAEKAKILAANGQSREFTNSNIEETRGLKKCQIKLKIDCDKSTVDNKDKINNEFNILTEKMEHGYSENEFNVEPNTKILQIKIAGNLSWILLQIPSRTTSEEIELSLMRDNDDDDGNIVMLQTKNPPSGNWRLKLRGSSDNDSYSLLITNTSDEFPIYSKKSSDLDDKLNSYEKDPDNRGIVIFFEDNDSPKSRHASLKYLDEDLSNDPLSRVNNNNTGRIVFQNSREELSSSMISVEGEVQDDDDLELDELSRAATVTSRTARLLIVDLAPETSLIARPNTIHHVIFTVTNNHRLTLYHTFTPKSTKFRIYNIVPQIQWIRAGETIKVGVLINIPNINDNIVNTVTLEVERGNIDSPMQKSAYIYVQSPENRIIDSTRPTIDYSFYDTCWGKQSQDRCSYTRWSVEITAADTESGLKRVASQPGGIRPKLNFVSGTKSPVNFIYTSTCCYSTVEITATDVVGNDYSRTIDVTAWWNLTAGEITAVVLGFLLLLIIIIIAVLLCTYWYRRRKSADLTYSQRYGSRTTPTNRTVERTSF